MTLPEVRRVGTHQAYNTVRFKPVTTSALRLELVMQPNVSAGVQEWKVK